jgi:hypothetical protein
LVFDPAYQLPWDRFIAPITDKKDELATRYSNYVYDAARAWPRDTELAIAIGYRFGEYDTASYKPLLHALPKDAKSQLSFCTDSSVPESTSA